jgi:hypothetical protein
MTVSNEEKVIDALKFLERKLGYSPSVADIAAQAGVSQGTAGTCLRVAAAKEIITQRNGKYMSHTVARAFDKGSE